VHGSPPDPSDSAYRAPTVGASTPRPGRLGVIGTAAVAWLTLLGLATLLAPWLPLSDPERVFDLRSGQTIAGPGTAHHLLGGDALGRDLLARVVWGARSSLVLALASGLVGLVIGGTLGLVGGYFRGRVDTVLSGVFDTLLSIPAIIRAVAMVAVFAPPDPAHPPTDLRRMTVLVLALGVVSIPIVARIARASALGWSQREFVVAARAIGATHTRVVVREILPNVLPAMLSVALLGVGVVIVAEGGLSLLGVGLQLPTPSWGNIIFEGQQTIYRTPWPILAPAAAIFLTVTSINYLGDVLRARFDVRDSLL
jgi:peptide/nickel transport system permease protein